MLGVCPGGAGKPYKDQTCDKHRGNIPLTVDPLKQNTISKIAYKSDGEIYSNDPAIQRDLDITLNLNSPESYLKTNRQAALRTMKKYFQQKYGAKEVPLAKLQRYKQDILKGSKNGQREPYAGILIAYIDRKIRHLQKS